MKKALLLPFIALLSVPFVTGCNSTKNDKNTLNIICFNKGYGREWIDIAVDIWKAANPNYNVNLNATADARSKITGNIYNDKNTDDLYISIGTDWKTYAGRGRLLELDDLLDETVDGVKVVDKINDEYKQSIYFKNRKGETHTYRLPWTSGIGGIFYNAKMFEDYGWSVPTTYDELITLCNRIVSEARPSDASDPTSTPVYPFSYTGVNTDYFDYTVFTWWSQLAGVDAITEFKKYESKANFDVSQNATYAKLKEATSMWYNLFGNKAYTDGEDISRDNDLAQKNFLTGKAAMMFDGDWVYNEMLAYTSNGKLPDNFKLGLMNTPTATGAVAPQSSYIIGEDQYIAIPATTIKADLAKSFIKTLISDDVLKAFHDKAHGLLGFKLANGSFSNDDPYMETVVSYRNNLTSTFTNFSSNPLFLNGFVDFWGATSGRPFEGLLKGSIKSLDEAFSNIYSTVNRMWDDWKSNSNG